MFLWRSAFSGHKIYEAIILTEKWSPALLILALKTDKETSIGQSLKEQEHIHEHDRKGFLGFQD